MFSINYGQRSSKKCKHAVGRGRTRPALPPRRSGCGASRVPRLGRPPATQAREVRPHAREMYEALARPQGGGSAPPPWGRGGRSVGAPGPRHGTTSERLLPQRVGRLLRSGSHGRRGKSPNAQAAVWNGDSAFPASKSSSPGPTSTALGLLESSVPGRSTSWPKLASASGWAATVWARPGGPQTSVTPPCGRATPCGSVPPPQAAYRRPHRLVVPGRRRVSLLRGPGGRLALGSPPPALPAQARRPPHEAALLRRERGVPQGRQPRHMARSPSPPCRGHRPGGRP